MPEPADKNPVAHRCSICGALSVAEFRPFCSARCSNVDLARWLGGVYAIPGGTSDDEDSIIASAPAPSSVRDEPAGGG